MIEWSNAIVTLSVLLTLIYASILDVKSREVNEVVWVPSFLISIIINTLKGVYRPENMLMILLSLTPALLVFILALLNLMGGADALALLLIGIAHPTFKVMPVSLLTLILSLIPPIMLMVYYALLNLLKYKQALGVIECVEGVRSKALLAFLGRLIDVGRYLESRFLYPLTIPLSNGGFRCRVSFESDEVEESIRDEVKRLVLSNVISPKQLIIVTPALPHILFILMGYFISILIPQRVILSIMFNLLHGFK